MKFTHQAVIDAPFDRIDLEDWLFSLSDADYQAAARGHKGAGSFVEDGVRGSVNVESVGGTLMVQHYHAVRTTPSHVEMFSTRTQAWIFHVLPVHFQVRWTMSVAPRTADAADFSCTVETQMPTVLRLAAASIFTPYFLRKHVEEETPLFAADISRKLARS